MALRATRARLVSQALLVVEAVVGLALPEALGLRVNRAVRA